MARDKFLHLVVGAAIVFVLAPFAGVYWALAACFAAGIGKEVYDSFFPKKHRVEVADAVYTILGGLGAAVFFL